MKTCTLNNGVEMPLLGFGTYQTAGDECARSVETALQCGYRLIDTATLYENEDQVGEAIRKSGVNRQEIFLVTKISFKDYEHTVDSVAASLKKLGTDYLDLVLLHWPFANYYKAWQDLEKLYQVGVIRAIGVSNFNPDRLVDLISYNKVVPAVNQIETHLYCQRQEHHKWEDQYGVAHMAYAPLGQQRAKEMFTEPAVAALAAKYHKSPAQIALRYLIQNDVIVIPKSTHAERIRENFALFDFALTPKEMESLRALDKNHPMIGTPNDPNKVLHSCKTWVAHFSE